MHRHTLADALQLVTHHLHVEGEAGDGGGGGRREALAGDHAAHLLQVGQHVIHCRRQAERDKHIRRETQGRSQNAIHCRPQAQYVIHLRHLRQTRDTAMGTECHIPN